jgi:outer membrane protein OmpA-like peptidoglycan-associated protein
MKTGHWMATAIAVLLMPAGAARPETAAPERVERHSTVALSFRDGDSTRVDIIGVTPRSGRIGTAEVKRHEGRTRIKLDIDKSLKNPQSLGSAYTAYVLWAVAPEGRAENLAELPVSRDFDLDATTSLDTFGLIVTAEPYAAVSRPGPLLVAQSGVREDTRAAVRSATVEYVVTPELARAASRPDLKTPLLLLGARRSVEIAKVAGAPEYAASELREAEGKLSALEQISRGKKELSKDAEGIARDVMRVADHARVVALDRADEAAQAAERRAAQSAIGSAKAEADRAQAEADEARARAARERQQALDARREAERAQGEATEAQTSLRAAQTDAERERQQADDARRDVQRAEQEAAEARTKLQAAQTGAERAQANEALARAEADRARAEAQQARQDKQEMEERLYRSLSEILETRREARGLIVNLSDVLFDFDRASLTPGAREKLSRLVGILQAYQGPYDIQIEGHTDSVGSHGYNQRLSEDRARSVASYLREAGIASARIVSVQGFAETQPVASNDSPAGRQRNRRVELVIGGLQG